jgi:hypothetical protein
MHPPWVRQASRDCARVTHPEMIHLDIMMRLLWNLAHSLEVPFWEVPVYGDRIEVRVKGRLCPRQEQKR